MEFLELKQLIDASPYTNSPYYDKKNKRVCCRRVRRIEDHTLFAGVDIQQFRKYSGYSLSFTDGEAQAVSWHQEHPRHTKNRALSSALSIKGYSPQVPEGLELRPFQEVGVFWLLANPSTIMGDEQGLGKTIQCCCAMNDPIVQPEDILIIAPKSVLQVWKAEMSKWCQFDIHFRILKKGPSLGWLFELFRAGFPEDVITEVIYQCLIVPINADNAELSEQRHKCWIMTHEMAKRYKGFIKRRKWDVFINDECHLSGAIGSPRYEAYGPDRIHKTEAEKAFDKRAKRAFTSQIKRQMKAFMRIKDPRKRAREIQSVLHPGSEEKPLIEKYVVTAEQCKKLWEKLDEKPNAEKGTFGVNYEVLWHWIKKKQFMACAALEVCRRSKSFTTTRKTVRRKKDRIPALQSRYKWMLSGTAMKNGLLTELQGVLEFLGFPIETNKFYGQFLALPEEEGLEKMGNMLRSLGYMIRREFNDCCKDIPKKTRRFFEIEPEGDLLEVVDAMGDYFDGEYSSVIADAEAEKDVASILEDEDSFVAACKKIDGALRDSAKDGHLAQMNRRMGLALVPFVIDHLKAAFEEHEKIVVLGWHPEVIDKILAAFPKMKPVSITGKTTGDRAEIVSEFQNNPACRLFGGSSAAYEGITLTAGTLLVFAEYCWTPGRLDQGEFRVYRIGQTKPTFVDFIVAQNSIAARMLNVTADKREKINQTMRKDAVEEVSIEPIPNAVKLLKEALLDGQVPESLMPTARKVRDREIPEDLAPMVATRILEVV